MHRHPLRLRDKGGWGGRGGRSRRGRMGEERGGTGGERASLSCSYQRHGCCKRTRGCPLGIREHFIQTFLLILLLINKYQIHLVPLFLRIRECFFSKHGVMGEGRRSRSPSCLLALLLVQKPIHAALSPGAQFCEPSMLAAATKPDGQVQL